MEDFTEQSFLPMQKAVESDRATLVNTRKELDLALKLAEVNLEMAELARRRLLGTRQWQLELAGIDEELAAVEEEKDRLALENSTALAEKALVAQTVVKADHVAWLNAAAHLEETRNRRRRLQRGPEPIQLRKADNRIREARENLENARYNRQVRTELKELEVVDAEARYKRMLVDKRRRERDIEYCAVKALVPGVVVYVNVWKGSNELSPIHVGETRTRGQDLLKIADISEMQVRMVVPEADIGLIRKGQQAGVRFVAFPDLELPAEVRRVTPTASDKNQLLGTLALAKSGQAVVRAFEVFLALKEKDERLRLGLTAEAEIVVARQEQALVIPLSAVVYRSGAAYVLTRADGGKGLKEVELGLAGETEAVVQNGLEEGDEILDEPARIISHHRN
jgi:HlyD family secretion protein